MLFALPLPNEGLSHLLMEKKSILTLVLIMAVSMLLAACGGNKDNSSASPSASAPASSAAPTASGSASPSDSAAGTGALADALAGKFKGTKVTMFGPFVDADQVKFEEAIKDFETKSGIDIAYEGSKEFEATVKVRVDGGNASDIIDFPQPGLLANIAKTGKVIDVSSFLDQKTMESKYNKSWLDMASMDGASGKIMAGVWARSSVKSLVWYNKKEFEAAGYTAPKTWDELMALTEQIAKDGDPAWAIGIESGAGTGWTATDWIEDIMLRTTSPENYDKWVKGELPFTDPIVKNAVQKMSDLWFKEGAVYGGRKSIVTTAFGDAPKVLFDNPPKAWLHRQASFITSFFPQGLKASEDYDWFPLPSIDPQYGTPALVAGDIYAMFNDRPEVRAVMEFFTTGESLKTWIQSGGVIAPMNDADPSWYSTDVERKMAEFVKTATTIRFDGSDLMPGEVGAGTFWKGMTDYVSGSVNLEKAMEEIQAGWKK
jgi:alpha-glucoside transport system substrate-binding protein